MEVVVFFENFPMMHVSGDKACFRNSCWSVGIVFTLGREEEVM